MSVQLNVVLYGEVGKDNRDGSTFQAYLAVNLYQSEQQTSKIVMRVRLLLGLDGPVSVASFFRTKWETYAHKRLIMTDWNPFWAEPLRRKRNSNTFSIKGPHASVLFGQYMREAKLILLELCGGGATFKRPRLRRDKNGRQLANETPSSAWINYPRSLVFLCLRQNCQLHCGE